MVLDLYRFLNFSSFPQFFMIMEGLKDSRIEEYFVQTAAAALGESATALAKLMKNRATEIPMETFLYDEACLLLIVAFSAATAENPAVIQVSNAAVGTTCNIEGKSNFNVIDPSAKQEQQSLTNVIFIKSCANGTSDLSQLDVCEIKASVVVITVPSSANIITTLRSSVHTLFAPILVETDRDDGQNSSKHKNILKHNDISMIKGNQSSKTESTVSAPIISYRAKKLILALDQELNSHNYLYSGRNKGSNSKSINDFSLIHTPLHEVIFWRDLHNINDEDTFHCKEAARYIFLQLQDVMDILELIDPSLPLPQISTSLRHNNNTVNHLRYGDDDSISSTRKNFPPSNLDYLENNFGDGSVRLEAALCNIFQVKNDNDDTFMYSAEVRPKTDSIRLKLYF